MNLLELNFERTWRGGERQSLYNMIGFRDAGHEVHLLCRKGYPLEEKAKKEGFNVHAFTNIFGAVFFLVLRCRHYKILHAQTSHILTYCVFTKIFHGAEVVFTRRVDFVPKGALTKFKYKITDEIVGISHAVKDILERFTGRHVALISDIAVAGRPDKTRAMQWLKDAGWQQGMYVAGTIAALVPHKDPLNMVEAIRLLSMKRTDFIFLHFGNGDLEDAVRTKIEEYNLQERYILMGFRENADDIFSVLEVFAMSSQEEGLGSSVLDAFLYKVPVVATDAGGLADIIKNGRGIQCNKKSPQMLADGIDLLLKDKGVRDEMVTLAYDYATDYHSMKYITDQYLELFK